MASLKFATAMLSRGEVGRTAVKTAGLAMVAAGSLAAPGADAATLIGTFVNPTTFPSGAPFSESFRVQTTGVPDATSGFYDFAITHDTAGADTLIFGDATHDGFVRTAGAGNTIKSDFLKASTPYNDAPFTLTAGSYTGSFGTTLTLSPVPEPDAWALLVAGVALTGGATRAARRRRQSAAIA